MAKYANPHRARGICDRCGFAFRLSELRAEYVLNRDTGLLVCRACWDVDHPQNYVGYIDANDAQVLEKPRPEDNRQSRAINWRERPGPARTGYRVGRVKAGAI